MSFSFRNIQFCDFRNYRHLRLEGLGSLTVFIGPNAVGKTNIIEGIQLLSSQHSFRNPRLDELLRFGCERAQLQAQALGDDGRQLDLLMAFEQGRKSCSVNGKKRRPADMKGLVPSVVFTPDHLNLVKGPSIIRRHELDLLGCQLSANHRQLCKDYEKILRTKNMLLKEGADELYRASVDDALVRCGALLTCYRQSLFENMMRKIAVRYADIAGSAERLTGRYIPSWEKNSPTPASPANVAGESEDKSENASTLAGKENNNTAAFRAAAQEKMHEAIERRKEEEARYRRALVGPHADSLYFYLNGRDTRVFASQGQQRSIVLAYKLAEIDIIQEMLGCVPLLLLDDVMSELDETRRRALLLLLQQVNQAFITTTNLSYFNRETLSRAKVVFLGEQPCDEHAVREAFLEKSDGEGEAATCTEGGSESDPSLILTSEVLYG